MKQILIAITIVNAPLVICWDLAILFIYICTKLHEFVLGFTSDLIGDRFDYITMNLIS